MKDPIKKLRKWYSGLPSFYKVILMSLAVIIVGILLLAMLPTLPSAPTNKTSEFYIKYQKRYSELSERIKSFLFPEKQVKPEVTIYDILCSYLILWNQSNMTLGNITCFKDMYGFQCFCISH